MRHGKKEQKHRLVLLRGGLQWRQADMVTAVDNTFAASYMTIEENNSID